MPTAVPPHPKALCQYRLMSKDESYHRNVTEIPIEADAKYGWVVTGNNLWVSPPFPRDWAEVKNRPEGNADGLRKALERCGKISGFRADLISEHYGFTSDPKTGQIHMDIQGRPLTLYTDYLFRASFFTQHAEKDSGFTRQCIADVLAPMMHPPMQTETCGHPVHHHCLSDHRVSKCYQQDGSGEAAVMPGATNCPATGKCYKCVIKRVRDPLWPLHAQVQCHYGYGLTLEQIQEHNRIYETTQLPDPCPGAAGYKPTNAASPDNGVWIEPASGPRKTKRSGGAVQTTMIA
nr:hypothetical protein B0A51_06138 [Rachicladosporium sp. CCFEE 5018]